MTTLTTVLEAEIVTEVSERLFVERERESPERPSSLNKNASPEDQAHTPQLYLFEAVSR
jgi:hypothetical protein